MTKRETREQAIKLTLDDLLHQYVKSTGLERRTAKDNLDGFQDLLNLGLTQQIKWVCESFGHNWTPAA